MSRRYKILRTKKIGHFVVQVDCDDDAYGITVKRNNKILESIPEAFLIYKKLYSSKAKAYHGYARLNSSKKIKKWVLFVY